MTTTAYRSTLTTEEARYQRHVVTARTHWLEAFRTGHKAGLSVRRMADIADVSPVRASQLLQETEAGEPRTSGDAEPR